VDESDCRPVGVQLVFHGLCDGLLASNLGGECAGVGVNCRGEGVRDGPKNLLEAYNEFLLFPRLNAAGPERRREDVRELPRRALSHRYLLPRTVWITTSLVREKSHANKIQATAIPVRP